LALTGPVAIQPIERAFAVLEVLSRRQLVNMNQLMKLTKLPRPTITRMLHSLIALGYVTRLSREQGYRVTDKVLSLASGLRFVDRLVDAAIGPMDKFTKTSGWPLVLGTVDHGSVVVRYSTIPISPLSLEPSRSGVRFSVLESAMGRACLAYCSTEETADVLREAASLKGPHAPEAFWRAWLEHPEKLEEELKEVRMLGFAGTRSSRAGRVYGIAVPVIVAGRAVAAISMRYPKSAMPEEQAAKRYAPKLLTLARDVARATDRTAATAVFA
jgi:IclR family mhp operon transcriptional activator